MNYSFYKLNHSLHLCFSVPTSPPLNPTVSAVNSTAITFSWEHPPSDKRNGIITGYSLVLTELPTNMSTSYDQNGTWLVIGSLHPFYDYECMIAAKTNVGSGPYGSPFITRTSPDSKETLL